MSEVQFDVDNINQWCPGCGNFGILRAMKKAFVMLSFEPKDILIVSGIGQAGKTPNYIACNMLHGLHGRALALATGAKTANHNLNILVNSGDGDCYGEGANHFFSAIRRNVDICLLVHNSYIYGLTKGQASPTSPFGMKTKMQKYGTTSSAFNSIAIALSAGAKFIARGFSGNIEQLSELIVQAMNYKGFAMIDICQPCVTFNKTNTNTWYKERVFDLKNENHDTANYQKALELALNKEEKIPTGIIYKKEDTPFHKRIDSLKIKPLVDYEFDLSIMQNILNNL